MALKSFHQPEKFSDTGKTLSPAEQARKVIDDRIGSVVVQNYNWRRIAVGLLISNVALAGGLTYQASQSHIVPYVVTVDKSTGEVEKAGAFVSQDYTPQEVEVRYFIGQFIQNARNIQLDPVQQEKMQGKAFAYLTQAAAQKYSAIQRNEGFKEKYAMYTIQTKITGIKKIPDTDSYHATWTEEEFNIASGKQDVKKYECVFAVTTIPPKDDQTLMVNPLGLYISDLNFSAEIGTKQKNNPLQPTAPSATQQDQAKQ